MSRLGLTIRHWTGRVRVTVLAAAVLAALVASGTGSLRADEIVTLRAYPETVELTTAAARQSVVVQAELDSGLTRDVTDLCEFSLHESGVAELAGHTLFPRSDGVAELIANYGGRECRLSVKVTRAETVPDVSFHLDVMPLFMRAGCNSGSCHGAARGKDGFRLSLFGYDPRGDYFRITREQPGRRIDLAFPESSLLLEKPVAAVPHTGGKKFDPDSEAGQTLRKWIAAGAPDDPAEVPVCTDLQLYPPGGVLDGSGATQRLVAVARYSDGTMRDVTPLALFLSSNDNSAAVNADGLVTAGARGEAFVMARFATFTVGSQFIVLPAGLDYQETPVSPANEIDVLVADKLRKLRMHPSERSTDEEFLRRVTIDLTGLLPTVAEFDEFLADESPGKRARKIDELLARKEFTDLWVSKWAEWLMMRSRPEVSQKSIVLYQQWLVNQVAGNVPLDEMVKDLLSASGGTFELPQTNFYEIERDQLKVAENVAQIFMGMRIQCAQCHNHPFDRWTQDDYYRFSAFFSQIGRKRGADPREQIVFNRREGDVKHPVTGQVAPPKFLGGAAPETPRSQDRRALLANWLVSNDNPWFARNFANRIWQHFFGIGIVEPVDDVRISNPASNPQLLDALARRLADSKYDVKGLVREICNSETYQRSTRRNDSNRTDERNFAHQTIRRIKAESLLDIISQVTQTRDDLPKLSEGARAVQIADGANSTYFLTAFGRASRETACSCEVKVEPNLSQALHLLNGETVNQKIRQGKLFAELKAQPPAPAEIIRRLYVACLTRPPTEAEIESLAPLFAEGQNVEQGLEDVFWALLNSREFLFNH